MKLSTHNERDQHPLIPFKPSEPSEFVLKVFHRENKNQFLNLSFSFFFFLKVQQECHRIKTVYLGIYIILLQSGSSKLGWWPDIPTCQNPKYCIGMFHGMKVYITYLSWILLLTVPWKNVAVYLSFSRSQQHNFSFVMHYSYHVINHFSPFAHMHFHIQLLICLGIYL